MKAINTGPETALKLFLRSFIQSSPPTPVLAYVLACPAPRKDDMKTLVTYRKAGMRYAILMVLGMALMIVAKPQSAMATTPCVQNCLLQLQFCIATCPSGMSCAQTCDNQFTHCRLQC